MLKWFNMYYFDYVLPHFIAVWDREVHSSEMSDIYLNDYIMSFLHKQGYLQDNYSSRLKKFKVLKKSNAKSCKNQTRCRYAVKRARWYSTAADFIKLKCFLKKSTTFISRHAKKSCRIYFETIFTQKLLVNFTKN